MPVRRTEPVVSVLRLFLTDPWVEHHGYEIAQALSLHRPTVYKILDRLANDGWLTHRDEEGSTRSLGHPPRTFYQLTPEGFTAAQQFVDRS
jgi:PadR family transcriptional regulator, regulatory protein PadR